MEQRRARCEGLSKVSRSRACGGRARSDAGGFDTGRQSGTGRNARRSRKRPRARGFPGRWAVHGQLSPVVCRIRSGSHPKEEGPSFRAVSSGRARPRYRAGCRGNSRHPQPEPTIRVSREERHFLSVTPGQSTGGWACRPIAVRWGSPRRTPLGVGGAVHAVPHIVVEAVVLDVTGPLSGENPPDRGNLRAVEIFSGNSGLYLAGVRLRYPENAFTRVFLS